MAELKGAYPDRFSFYDTVWLGDDSLEENITIEDFR